MLKIVFDANIYLAAMGVRGFCYDLLFRIFSQPSQYCLFISEDIIKEVENGAAKLLKNKTINNRQKEKILFFLKKKVNKVFIYKRLMVPIRGKNDIKILECAVSAEADLIISIDKDLLKLKAYKGTGIIHPKTFFYILQPKRG